MKEYAITITETLQKTVYIKADSVKAAKDIARENWKNGEYILNAYDIERVTFKKQDELITLIIDDETKEDIMLDENDEILWRMTTISNRRNAI